MVLDNGMISLCQIIYVRPRSHYQVDRRQKQLPLEAVQGQKRSLCNSLLSSQPHIPHYPRASLNTMQLMQSLKLYLTPCCPPHNRCASLSEVESRAHHFPKHHPTPPHHKFMQTLRTNNLCCARHGLAFDSCQSSSLI